MVSDGTNQHNEDQGSWLPGSEKGVVDDLLTRLTQSGVASHEDSC